MQFLLFFLYSVTGKVFVDAALRFIAWKVLVYTLLTITFPIIIKNLVKWGFDLFVEIIQDHVSVGALSAQSLQLTGLAGYLGHYLMLDDCCAILLSAVSIRFVLNFIPFVG